MMFTPGRIGSSSPLEPRKALLLIDFQNDFVDQVEGRLPVPNVQSFIHKLPALAAKFRAKGPVIFIQTEFQEARSALSPEVGSYNILLQNYLPKESPPSQLSRKHRRGRSSGSFKSIDPEAFLQAGTDEAERLCSHGTFGAMPCSFTADSYDPKRDLNITKSHYSAFKDTSLLTQLRIRMIQHLYVAGSLSNISVYATVSDAVRHGLEVTLIEDCLGYRDVQCHHEAIKQMVDMMGATGVDHQELMDDLAGLLGDVIREEDFATHFQVTVSQVGHGRATRAPGISDNTKSRVERWVTEHDTLRKRSSRNAMGAVGILETLEVDDSADYDSQLIGQAHLSHSRQVTPESTSSKKRSSPLPETASGHPSPRLTQHSSIRRTPSESGRYQVNRPRMRGSRPSSNRAATPSSARVLSSSMCPSEAGASSSSPSNLNTDSPGLMPLSLSKLVDIDDSEVTSFSKLDYVHVDLEMLARAVQRPLQRNKKAKNSSALVGPAEPIGEGDSSITGNVVSYTEADAAFYALKRTVQWQKMLHRTGEVPRLVAVQGAVDESTATEPIYRHPADESPEMLPFDDTVNMLRAAAEKYVGHDLNHVLIQYYRSGEDNISEHSDKTLDVVRGSSVVNLSLGAQRIMTLRTKKDPTLPSAGDGAEGPERRVQRVPLMHNSIFVLGPSTNQYWMHSVRADKRPSSEKVAEELAYGGERISLTFRQIGTFVNKKEGLIWGQGARGKTNEAAGRLLQGVEAEREGENMIRAFGQENHLSATWDWDRWYGEGFDVVNFETKVA